jgi:hypothetical protein
MFFSKKSKAKPATPELTADFRRTIAEAVAAAEDSGLGIHTIVDELNTRVAILRANWATTAPLGQRCP